MIRVDKGCAGALVWLKCSKNTAKTLLSQRSFCTGLAAFPCVSAAEVLLMSLVGVLSQHHDGSDHAENGYCELQYVRSGPRIAEMFCFSDSC
jgi:hypothetical protein